ncbi:MAG: hypothetical protein EZS28_014595, partial [Streblomastix strix]
MKANVDVGQETCPKHKPLILKYNYGATDSSIIGADFELDIVEV